MRSTIVEGKATWSPDPICEHGIACLRECDDDRLDDTAVVREVVAADDVERPGARGAACGEARHEQAGGACGRIGMRQIVDDVGMLEIELSRRWIVAVTLFRDGERDNADLRCGDPRDDARAIGSQEQRLPQRAHDARARAGGILFERRIQTVLRREGERRPRRLEADPADAPLRIARDHRVGVDRLMGAMERAQPQVNDPHAQRRDVVAGPRDRRGHARERCEAQ